jgi:hypothetical protein
MKGNSKRYGGRILKIKCRFEIDRVPGEYNQAIMWRVNWGSRGLDYTV